LPFTSPRCCSIGSILPSLTGMPGISSEPAIESLYLGRYTTGNWLANERKPRYVVLPSVNIGPHGASLFHKAMLWRIRCCWMNCLRLFLRLFSEVETRVTTEPYQTAGKVNICSILPRYFFDSSSKNYRRTIEEVSNNYRRTDMASCFLVALK